VTCFCPNFAEMLEESVDVGFVVIDPEADA
jgi:hypothetical protein